MNLVLRPAAPDEQDARLLYEWRTDPETRRNSFQTEMFPYEEHLAWFQKMMQDPQRHQYILMAEGEDGQLSPAGQLRLDVISEDTAEISYGIAGEFRRRGLGTRLLAMAEEAATRDLPRIRELLGEVLKDNPASQRAFLKNGYTETVEEYCLVYRKALDGTGSGTKMN